MTEEFAMEIRNVSREDVQRGGDGRDGRGHGCAEAQEEGDEGARQAYAEFRMRTLKPQMTSQLIFWIFDLNYLPFQLSRNIAGFKPSSEWLTYEEFYFPFISKKILIRERVKSRASAMI